MYFHFFVKIMRLLNVNFRTVMLVSFSNRRILVVEDPLLTTNFLLFL